MFAAFTAVSFVVLVVVSKPLAEAYGGVRLALMEMMGATVTLIPWAVTATWGPPRWSWLLLFVLGLVHTALGLGLYLSALGRVPATHVGIMGYLEPVGVVVVAALFLDEALSTGTVVGGALILAAGALLIRRREVRRCRSLLAAETFLGNDLLPLLVLALGGALVVGNTMALIRPPAKPKAGELARAPVGRTVTMLVVGLVAAIWALASLVSG